MSQEQESSTDGDAKAAPARTGNPLFSGPAVPTQAVRANRPVTPAFGAGVQGQPAQQPAAGQPAEQPSAPVNYAATLAEQLESQAAAIEQDTEWYAAGMGPHDGHLIEQCKRHGLTPQDLRIRVDGRTMVSRLKNGESVSSVRSRIDEASR